MSAEQVLPSRQGRRRPDSERGDGSAAPIMSLALSCAGPASVISVAGEVDVSNAHLITELVEFLCRPRAPLITLDLSAVCFFGAHGISALLQATESAVGAGGRLTVRAPSPFVRHLLGVSGASRHLTFESASEPGGYPDETLPRPARRSAPTGQRADSTPTRQRADSTPTRPADRTKSSAAAFPS